MYQEFARIYDRLMDDVDYSGWAEFYMSMISAAGAQARECAECGCGTGSMTIELARRGIRVVASDLSEEMLMLAAEKARRAGRNIRFVRQDMRALRLPRRVDAVLCCCDGVNYLTQDQDALAFFQAAHAALKPGGILAFDISSRSKLHRMAREGMYGEDRDEVTYLWMNRTEGEELIHMDLTFFLRQKDGRYCRFDEAQVQRAYSEKTMRGLLERARFEDIRIYGDKTLNAPGPDDDRIHFTARKANI